MSFFKEIKSLFQKPKDYKEFGREVLSKDVNEIKNSLHELDELIDLMEIEFRRIKSLAKDYPNNGMNGGTWFDGVALANSGQYLAEYLSGHGLESYEEKAVILWVKSTLAVCSHYHHMVGPAMIGLMEISEKVGKLEKAKECCEAIKKDFIEVLETAEEDVFYPEQADELSLQCLEKACNKLQTLGNSSSENIEIISRINSVFTNPKYVYEEE